MAGTVSLLDRTFGFFAVRDGARYAPEGRALGSLQVSDADRPGRKLVEARGEQTRLEGQPTSLEAITAALRPIADADPAPWVLIRVRPDLKYADLARVVDAITSAGIGTIRFEAIK